MAITKSCQLNRSQITSIAADVRSRRNTLDLDRRVLLLSQCLGTDYDEPLH
ncbi:MAG: hypothetical protein L7T26_06720 [Pseudomonadales bacterium]|nr:hypothetical protein [Pseudomonadales bacterium]